MSFSWVTSSAIEFTSNGVKVMGDLSKASKALGDSLKVLAATVDGVVASLDLLSASAIRATDALVDLNIVTGKSNTSQARSTTRVTRAASAYDAMAVSAARAAAGVKAVGTASAGSRVGLPRGGGSGGGSGAGGFLSMLPGPLGIAGRIGSIANTLTGGGLGHLAEGGMLVDAVVEAGKLQQIMLSIKNETGASKSQIAKFENTAYTIGAQNGMSSNEAGEILRTISRLTAGQFSTDKMIQIAPMVAQYASLTHFNRPDISVEEAAKTGIQTAHLFRAYTPDALKPLLDKVYRLSGMMAEKPDAALRQMSYYVPLFKAAHVSDETSLGTMALLDRAGFRNKVGSNVRAMALESFGPQQLTSFAQKGKGAILEDMGLFKNGKFAWNDKNGGFDFFGELGAVSKWAAKEEKNHVPMSTVIKELTGSLGRTGSTVAALFLDKQMPGILDGIRKYLKDPNVGLEKAKVNRDQGFDYQFTTAGKNFQSLATELGGVALPGLTKAFKDLGDGLHSAQVWLHQHKALEQQWADNITNTVKGIESYFVTHKKDLLAIGKLFLDIGHWASTLAVGLGNLIGPLTTIAGIVANLADVLVGAPVTKQQIAAHDKLVATLNAAPSTAPGGGTWNTPQSRANANNAGTLTDGMLHIQQHFHITGPADKATVAAAAHAGTTAAIAAAQKKAPTHGTLFTLPNTANLSVFGSGVVGAH